MNTLKKFYVCAAFMSVLMLAGTVNTAYAQDYPKASKQHAYPKAAVSSPSYSSSTQNSQRYDNKKYVTEQLRQIKACSDVLKTHISAYKYMLSGNIISNLSNQDIYDEYINIQKNISAIKSQLNMIEKDVALINNSEESQDVKSVCNELMSNCLEFYSESKSLKSALERELNARGIQH